MFEKNWNFVKFFIKYQFNKKINILILKKFLL